jgi:DNA (cytosine-5)-methyltransferase 1
MSSDPCICYTSSVPTDSSVVRETRAKYVRARAQIKLQLVAGEPVTPKPRPATNLRTVGLFAGIGGLELGLAQAGHRSVLFCEIEPGARAVLAARFPNVECASDVTQLDALPARTDLLVGGFPCQDLSQAGRTAGLAGKNSGLVSHVFRLIERQRPRWLILENVSFMLSLAKGRAMAAILRQLEGFGYRWAYRVVDTRSFGLPQRRERVFIVASLDSDPRSVLFADDAGEEAVPVIGAGPSGYGFYWTEGIRGLGWGEDVVPTLKGGSTIGIASPPAIWFPGGAPEIVKPDIRDAERMQGFEPDWTKPAEAVTRKNHRWKLVGNAVTVNVAAWLGRRLADPGNYDERTDEPLGRGVRWPRAAYNVGSGVREASVSSWPLAVPRPRLQDFLRYEPVALSARGASGFLERTSVSTLRFKPEFLKAVRRHLKVVLRDEARG